MRHVLITGILLIVSGVIALTYRNDDFSSSRGTIHADQTETRVESKPTSPLPPLLGASALAAGTALFVSGAKKAKRS